MSPSTAFIVVPPIFFPAWIILWHLILMLKRANNGSPASISAHAEVHNKLLLIHRLSHGLPLVLLWPFLIDFLIPNGYGLAAALLFAAATFDVAEVATLRRAPDSNLTIGADSMVHKITAWCMAVSYLLYTVVICTLSGVGLWLFLPVFLISFCLVGVLLVLKIMTKRHFYFLQVLFFSLVSFAILIIHVAILARAYL